MNFIVDYVEETLVGFKRPAPVLLSMVTVDASTIVEDTVYEPHKVFKLDLRFRSEVIIEEGGLEAAKHHMLSTIKRHLYEDVRTPIDDIRHGYYKRDWSLVTDALDKLGRVMA